MMSNLFVLEIINLNPTVTYFNCEHTLLTTVVELKKIRLYWFKFRCFVQ